MERSHPPSGRSATPADINRNGRPTSIGTGGRHQSECPADIIGIRRVHGEGELGPFSHSREHLAEPSGGDRRRALGKKNVPPLRLLAVEAAKIADLGAAHRMHARHSVLDALHVEEPMRQVDLIPAQRAQLSRPQPMPVCDEDHRCVAVPIASALARRLPEQLDFLGCQVLARPTSRVELPPRRDCPIFGVWRRSPTGWFRLGNA